MLTFGKGYIVVMMPYYTKSRFAALYFIVFSFIGTFLFMNMLTATIYIQFRGYFQDSMQATLLRKRVAIRAAFEVLLRRRSLSSMGVSDNNPSINPDVRRAAFIPDTVVNLLIRMAHIGEFRQKYMLRLVDAAGTSEIDVEKFRRIFDHVDRRVPAEGPPAALPTRFERLRPLQRLVSHANFPHFGNVLAVAGIIMISLSLTEDCLSVDTLDYPSIVNNVFLFCFVIEFGLQIWALGMTRFCYELTNVINACITTLLLGVTLFHIVTIYLIPLKDSCDSVVTINMVYNFVFILIICRAFRLVLVLPMTRLVTYTMFDLVSKLRPFAGILAAIYYIFACCGLWFFQDTMSPSATEQALNGTTVATTCGTFEQLQYYANNFNDFYSALIVLWDVMVVNNWQVFLDVFARRTGSKYSHFFFIVWWLASTVICLNIFLAIILDNFSMRCDLFDQAKTAAADNNSQPQTNGTSPSETETSDELARLRRQLELSDSTAHVGPFGQPFATPVTLTLQDLFRENLKEPLDEEILGQVYSHPCLRTDTHS